MKGKELKEYLGKKNLKIFLKNGFVYNGEILSVLENSIEILDKFDNRILLDIDYLVSVGETNRIPEPNYE